MCVEAFVDRVERRGALASILNRQMMSWNDLEQILLILAAQHLQGGLCSAVKEQLHDGVKCREQHRRVYDEGSVDDLRVVLLRQLRSGREHRPHVARHQVGDRDSVKVHDRDDRGDFSAGSFRAFWQDDSVHELVLQVEELGQVGEVILLGITQPYLEQLLEIRLAYLLNDHRSAFLVVEVQLPRIDRQKLLQPREVVHDEAVDVLLHSKLYVGLEELDGLVKIVVFGHEKFVHEGSVGETRMVDLHVPCHVGKHQSDLLLLLWS